MPQHAAAPVLGACLVGVFKHAAACRSTLKFGLGLFETENIRPKYQSHSCAVVCQRWPVLQWLNGASVIERSLVQFQGLAI